MIENESDYIVMVKKAGYMCYRCGSEWIPKFKRKPRVCPKCNSPYWDRPRRAKKEVK